MNKQFEISLVFITAILKWVLVDGFQLRVIFIPIAFIIWVLFIAYKAKNETQFFKNSGFTTKSLKASSIICMTFILSFGAIMLAFAKLNHYNINNYHLVIAILLYPFWGLLQQFIVMRFVAANLKKFKLKSIVIIWVTALAFGSVHIPVWPLFAATFIIGLMFTSLYIKYKNLWPLGITHGILGAFFYFYVLNEDPIAQIISSYNFL
ncbi:MAG: type II CAAX prenyl endopeptidase Rce1 family protein [Bacteroidia bacterium]